MGEEQATNDDQKQLAAAVDTAHEGAMFADWRNQYCTKKMFTWLDEQISDSKNKWLMADSREKAEAIRLQSQAYVMIKNWAVAKIATGNVAARAVKEFHEEGIELEGLIKPPPAR